MTCTPLVTVSVTVSGGTMTRIDIFDDTADTGTGCNNATSCSLSVASGHSIRLDMNSGDDGSSVMGSPFTYTCPGSAPQAATFDGQYEYQGYCPTTGSDTPVTANYNATAAF
jgi:hypothetical protein